MTDRGVFDPGLQPERTALSWRRAALSLAGVSLLLGRVLVETAGLLGVAVEGLGVAAALATAIAGERRYRGHHARLMAAGGARIPLAAGALPLALASTIALLGLCALAAVLVATFD